MSAKTKELNMTEGPFLSKIIRFVIPVIITGFLQCFYNAADLAVVGKFRGELALAAVGSTSSLNSLIVNVFMGLSVGAGVVVAQQLGAREYTRVKKTVHSAILLALISGIVVGIFGFIFCESLLRMMDTPESVIHLASLYLRIIFCGLPASMIYNYCAAMLRSAGDTRNPLIFLSISGISNVTLNFILVAFFGLGVSGVAIATIFSQYLSAVMVLVFMAKQKGAVSFSLKDLKFDLPSVKKMLAIGIPSGIQTSLFSLANVMIQSSINSFGDIAMAGNSAATSIEGFIHTAMVSVYQASMTFTGQNVGAKKYKNIKKIMLLCLATVTVVGIVGSGTVFLFRDLLLGLYADNPAAIEVAKTRMIILLPLYFGCGMMDVMSGVIRGMGRSVTAMINSLSACVIRILWVELIFYVVPHEIEWVFVAFPISWYVVLTLHLICFAVFYKRLLRTKEST